MVEIEKMKLDILDIMVSMKKGYSIADLMMQLANLYAPLGEKPNQEQVESILDEFKKEGYIKEFMVGTLPSYKITDEGEEFFYTH